MQHHALLVISSREQGLLQLEEGLRVPHLDVVHMTGERMGINDVRTLVYESHLMPFEAPVRSFVLLYENITDAAQNALLKLLEEPPRTARFYVVVPREALLIPTLRSRLMIQTSAGAESTHSHAQLDIIRMSYKERLAYVGMLIKKADEEGMRSLMRAIEESAYTHEDDVTLQEIVSLQPMFDTQGASKKMILEHLVLSLSKSK